MAKKFNTDGRLILSKLSMEEKTEIILAMWAFLEEIASTFSREFEPIGWGDGDDVADCLNGLGFDDQTPQVYVVDHIWTSQGNNSDIVFFGGIDFGIWGTALVPRYISVEEDVDEWVRMRLVSKVSRSSAKGLYRDLYSKACPENPQLPLSDIEKQGTLFDKDKQEYFVFEWNDAPYVWQRPNVQCPFCNPTDGQSAVDCPANESKLRDYASEHEETQSFIFSPQNEMLVGFFD